jgi:hypothetical protein
MTKTIHPLKKAKEDQDKSKKKSLPIHKNLELTLKSRQYQNEEDEVGKPEACRTPKFCDLSTFRKGNSLENKNKLYNFSTDWRKPDLARVSWKGGK